VKAISHIINFSKAFASLGVVLSMGFALGVPTEAQTKKERKLAEELAAEAEANHMDEDGREYSAIGIATGLPLYDTDKADTCVPGALQIRRRQAVTQLLATMIKTVIESLKKLGTLNLWNLMACQIILR